MIGRPKVFVPEDVVKKGKYPGALKPVWFNVTLGNAHLTKTDLVGEQYKKRTPEYRQAKKDVAIKARVLLGRFLDEALMTSEIKKYPKASPELMKKYDAKLAELGMPQEAREKLLFAAKDAMEHGALG